jgi:hypothetical protein
MSIRKTAALRACADELGISEAEWQTCRAAKPPEALAFYVELRRALRAEYEGGVPFYLPANDLALRQFLPGRRDRKFYMKLIGELLKLTLLERVKAAGFGTDGRREPARFMFTTRSAQDAGNVVFLSTRRSTKS